MRQKWIKKIIAFIFNKLYTLNTNLREVNTFTRILVNNSFWERKMQKIKIAIIDDSQQTKEVTRQNFESDQNFDLVYFDGDGARAYEGVVESTPDVVLLDLVLPNKDGLAVLGELQSLGEKTKVVVTTALTNENFVQKAIELGADDYIVKPYDIDVLKQRIEAVIAKETKSKGTAQSKIDMMFGGNSQKSIKNRNLEERISNIFIMVGIPAHIKGYQFLREAIKMAIDEPEIVNSITKKLYPNIALKFDTSASKVERAIRHAIEVAWNRGKIENINDVFGLRVYDSNEKPTNGEFIALVADKMIIEGC